MSTLAQAVQTQISNIEKKTGKTLAELSAFVHHSGFSRHGEVRELLISQYGLGHGDANALVHAIFESDGTRAAAAKALSGDGLLDEMYGGAKAGLRPIHTAVQAALAAYGDYETLPKKGYVSLRRKRQFAMLGPATNTRVELGLNIKFLPADPRLLEQPQGRMCNYIVRLTDPAQVDAPLLGWLRAAFDAAG
jgi:hypothetical protein